MTTTTKKAFYVKAKIEDKSWQFRATTLTAADQEEAIKKATHVLGLTPEHVIEIKPVTVHCSTAKLTSESYPYGRLRTTAYFSVEFTKNGFRSVFQTIDPKSGRINKPKKSTYYPVLLPTSDDNNFYSYCGYLSFNGNEEINKGLQFMIDFKELFTEDEIKQINAHIYAMMFVSMKSCSLYRGANPEHVKPLYIDKMKAALKGEYEKCFLDLDKIKALKDPEYNPFQSGVLS